MSETFDILAATAFGLEAVTARELHDLGYADAKGVGTGRVLFQGDALAVARANIRLRTADRVLIRVGTFPAKDFGQLFDGANALPWERWIPADARFPVNGRSVRSQLSSVPACQRIVKKAIVERLLAAHKVDELPETGATVEVEVALLKDEATLTIDTSGAGLHKRGYRPIVGEAALKETLAAGLVLLSNWRPERALIDPFCGTGTIAIEAALIGRNIAPGIARSFDAEKWAAIPPGVWEKAREEARAGVLDRLPITIHASDIDDRALAVARDAAKAAGVERDVHFQKRDLADLASKSEHGVIITNPPYGVRLGDAPEIDRLYRLMPVVFRRLPTWSFHVLTARLDMEQVFGQQATRRRKLYNSRIECTYFSFLGPKPLAMRRDHGERTDDESPNAADGQGAGDDEAPAFGGLRERDVREGEQFAARLAKNVRHLRRYPSRGITCYRVYERDCVDTPLIIDRYEDAVHVAEYERGHSRSAAQQADWWDQVRRAVSDATGVPTERIFTKEKHRQSDFSQHEKVGDEHKTLVVQEGGLKFEVNLSDYIDTGLFLDHRLTRQMVREEAGGRRFLNLFCYTGAFTVYAAAGGAKSTTSVDLSNTYLEWCGRNLALNGFIGREHSVVRSGVMEWLRGQRPGPAFDLAVIDPPTFSRSKSTDQDWDVQADHAALFGLLTPLMSTAGVIYFSTNFRRFRLDEAALAGQGLHVREITSRTIPPEYRNRRIHRCWRIVCGQRA